MGSFIMVRKLGSYNPLELEGEFFRSQDPFMVYSVIGYDENSEWLTIGDPDNVCDIVSDRRLSVPLVDHSVDLAVSSGEVHAALSPPGP